MKEEISKFPSTSIWSLVLFLLAEKMCIYECSIYYSPYIVVPPDFKNFRKSTISYNIAKYVTVWDIKSFAPSNISPFFLYSNMFVFWSYKFTFWPLQFFKLDHTDQTSEVFGANAQNIECQWREFRFLPQRVSSLLFTAYTYWSSLSFFVVCLLSNT